MEWRNDHPVQVPNHPSHQLPCTIILTISKRATATSICTSGYLLKSRLQLMRRTAVVSMSSGHVSTTVRTKQKSIDRVLLVGGQQGRALAGRAAIGETASFQLRPSWCRLRRSCPTFVDGDFGCAQMLHVRIRMGLVAVVKCTSSEGRASQNSLDELVLPEGFGKIVLSKSVGVEATHDKVCDSRPSERRDTSPYLQPLRGQSKR